MTLDFSSEGVYIGDTSVVFLPKIDIKRLELNPEPFKDVKGLNSREVTFTGTYNNLEISCECIIAFGDVEYHHAQYLYGYRMHQSLYGCKYMTHYIGVFRAHVLDVVNFIQTPPKEPALFLVRTLYSGGTLGQYMKDKRKKELYMEPMHLLQMCISLFSMVKEAHLRNIGLVDISLEGLQVDVLGMLYFNGYQSCLDLQDTIVNRNKPWMVNKTLKIPEAKSLNNTYKKSADVFSATLIMLDLAKKFDYSKNILHAIRHNTQTVTINKEGIDPRHLVMFDIIQQGLNYDPELRPTASAILYALEASRYFSLRASDKPV